MIVIIFQINNLISSKRSGVLADLDPPRIGPPSPNPLGDMDPGGPYPLENFYPPLQIWTP